MTGATQGEIFAAEGYSKVTGKTSVCIATSGPGATNLVTGLADAMLDSIPMVAITGQVPRPMIGTDAFQVRLLWSSGTALDGLNAKQRDAST